MVATIITTGSIPRLLQDGIGKIFGDELAQHEPKYNKIFQVLKSKNAYEINVQLEGFGLATEKDQGDDITFDSRSQGFTPKYPMIEYSKGFIVSQTALEDELYGQFNDGARALGRSMNITREVYAHAPLNDGFTTDSAMIDGDGLALFSTAHLNGPSGGTFSNKLAVDADLSEASMEDMLALVQTVEDARGLPAALMAERLVVAAGTNTFQAQRIMGSVLQSDTAYNNTNAARDMNAIRQGWLSSPYLTDADAWFITTNAPNGLKFYQRVDIQFGQDNAFTSGNARFKSRMRQAVGYDDPRGVFGSAGG
jgi:hypothetical protein